MRWGILLAVLGACSEYGFSRDADPDRPRDTGDPDIDPDTDIETGASCDDRTIPGFDGAWDETCANEVETGTFNPVVEWAITRFATAPAFNNVMMHPIVASLTDDDRDGDIDDDDVPDIIFNSYTGSSWTAAGVLRAISGADGAPIFDIQAPGIQGSGSLAAGDIDGDGVVEIIGVTVSGVVMAFEHDGTTKWSSAPLPMPACYAAAPAIADMDADGSPEIVVGNHILDARGGLRGSGTSGNGQCISFPVDLDGDGVMEVIAGNAWYRPDGSTKWSAGIPDGYPAVADFNADGVGDVVVVASNGQVRLHDGTSGDIVWTAAGTPGYGPPTIADFDGDGEPEIGVAGRSTYTVLETDGRLLWQRATQDASSGRTGSSVFDFEGDGVAEVVYADETRLWVFSGIDGSVKLQDTNHTSWTWIEYATIADVDGDGETEIVVPNGQISSQTAGARYGITVIGDRDHSWMAGRRIWNQHAYHISNVSDRGGIPRVAERSWLTHNSFRSGDLTAGNGVSAPDLTSALADVCELDCDEGRLRVWLHIGNQGAVDAGLGAAVNVHAEIGADRVPLTEWETGPLPVARFQQAVQLDLSGEPERWDAIVVEVIGMEPECIEDNDVLRIPGPFCR